MAATPAVSTLAQFGVGTTSPVDTGIEVISSTLKKTATHVHSPGLRGARSRRKYRTRNVRNAIAGQWVLNPTPTEIDFFLQYILGGTPSAGVTDIADVLPSFYGQIDKVTKVAEYDDLRVARAIFAGSSGQPLTLTMELEGIDETITNAGTFPVLTLPTDNMFVFSDLILTLGGSAREVDEFTLTVDNMLLADLYRNSLNRAELPAADRDVSLDVTVPYTSDNEDLYDAAIAGAAAQLSISDGATTYTIDAANAQIPPDGPEVPGAGEEISLPLGVKLYADDTNSECKFTKS